MSLALHGWAQAPNNQPAPDQTPPASTTDIATPIVSYSKAAETNTHALASDDLIEIKIYQQPDLETKARIDQDGSITMPLLGSVKIAGKSVEEARVIIHDLLAKDYLVAPQVSITVVEYAKHTFTILGEVQKPGTYEIPVGGTFNLLQAIAFAGGYTRIGAPGSITLTRVENGQRKVIKLDAGSMAKDESARPFIILPNDTINVGERFF